MDLESLVMSKVRTMCCGSAYRIIVPMPHIDFMSLGR